MGGGIRRTMKMRVSDMLADSGKRCARFERVKPPETEQKNNFHLDSICPTGGGKVAGVKIEIDEEKLGGGGRHWLDLFIGLTAEKLALTLPSPPGEGFLTGPRGAGINGIGHEKAPAVARLPPSQSYSATSWRGKQMAQERRNFLVAHGRDYAFVRQFSRCRCTGQRHGQESGASRTAAIHGNGPEKTGMAQVAEKGLQADLGRWEAVL